MNPRHRRLLIPGLLIVLLVIVVVSSLVDRANGATAGPDVVSHLTDPRITESSGLVVSRTDDDLAYTVNDSGNASLVFAVQISTGATVGTAQVRADFTDTEALSIDGDGTLWVADTGDNTHVRTDAALYSLPEFGRTSRTVTASRYPLAYPDGPRDVEALVVNPKTGEKFLLTKGLLAGEVYAVPRDLVAGRANAVKDLDVTIPGVITDAAFTPDGRYVIARDYSQAHVLDATTWQEVATIGLPPARQGESLAIERTGASFLVGSEGADSPLNRVAFTDPEPAPSEPTASAAAGAGGVEDREDDDAPGRPWVWATAGAAVVLVLVAGAVLRRRATRDR